MTTFLDANGNPRRPRCYLGMPYYGQPTAGALRALYQYPGRGCDVTAGEATASLLAHGFNLLWTQMLTLHERGHRHDYFAMLHADVEPAPPTPGEPGWLDALIGELERTGADVLSVVVPIKDDRGITSTGIDGNDRWGPLFRVTMRQAMALPQTFSAADLGHPERALLVNTGCWVCRIDPEWTFDFPGFTINDRIMRNPAAEDGLRWEAHVEPEDWFASRWWHARGLDVRATTKVHVLHAGTARWGNAHVWGLCREDPDLDAEAAKELSARLGLMGGEE